MYLNSKINKSDKEINEYKLMLEHQDITDEFICSLVENGGVKATKSLFWGKVEFETKEEQWRTYVLFLALFAVVYFSSKIKQSPQ